MDWGVSQGTATIVALSDGNASVYLSSGGGFLGGVGQEPIRKAAQKAVDIAQIARSNMTSTTRYPLPDRGQVIFYVLSDSGVVTEAALEKDMKNDQPIGQLGNAMQDVITQYRLWSAQNKQ